MKRNLLFVILSFLSLNALGQTDIKFDPQAASEAVKRGGSEKSSYILVMWAHRGQAPMCPKKRPFVILIDIKPYN